MKLPLAYYGNPILRKKTTPITEITDDIRQLVADMEETMHHHNGVGLAAPQVLHSISLFITCIPRFDENQNAIPGVLRVFINPKILNYTEEVWPCEEGCLSIPKLYGEILRPAKVTVQAMDLNGQTFTEEFEHYDAHVVMHENDHINGVLYIDRLPPKIRKEMEPFLRDIKKKYNK